MVKIRITPGSRKLNGDMYEGDSMWSTKAEAQEKADNLRAYGWESVRITKLGAGYAVHKAGLSSLRPSYRPISKRKQLKIR